MAIYHFSAKVISRGAGSSAVAAAAYRSADRLYDARLDRHHDFSNKTGVVHSEVMLPDGAPEEWLDRAKLWNDVEAVEVRKDAQLAREIEFAIPREMTQADGIALARDFVQKEFVDRGMVADLNVHWDVGPDGLAKPHAHVMLGMREVGEDGFGAKVREWNKTELLTHWREAWAEHVNGRLAQLDIDARIDHRSLEAQGIDLEPQNKIGPAAARMAQEGLVRERLEEHFAIARSNGEKILENPGIALDAITHQQATFTSRDLATFVHRHSDGKDQFDAVLAAVRSSPDLVRLGPDGRGEERFTSRAMLETEQRLEKATARLDAQWHHAVPDRHIAAALDRAEARGLMLSVEQHHALEYVTGRGGLASVIGYAGTGKSAMLGVAREAWEKAGFDVRGIALSGIAAENLENGSGIASRTIASLEHQWAQGRETLRPNSILVIDEAGMIGTRQMERVISEAEEQGAKVVLVGDPQQLQAIEAGAAFRSMAERHGAVEITEVRRQAEEWQRNATRHLATGRTGEAIEAYHAAGLVVESPTRESARDALIKRWDADRQAHPEASRLILTHTNAECDELNAQARDRLRDHGTLGTDVAVETNRGTRLFADQDRIMFLRNERELGVKNGMLGTIERVDRTGMAVRLDDGRTVAFDHKDYADLTHGYAATVHKSQGATLDRVHVLATPGLDRHGAYVALSRHRDHVELHYAKADFTDRERLAQRMSRDRSKDMARDYAGQEQEQRAHKAEPTLQSATSAEQPERKQGRFAGLRLSVPSFARPPTQDQQAQRDNTKPTLAAAQQHIGTRPSLDQAVERYARATAEIDRMTRQQLPALEYQKTAQARAAQALDALPGGSARDLDTAFQRNPGLMAEAATGRTTTAIRAMQLEAEIRANPELRADRFVQSWQQLQAKRGSLSGSNNREVRQQVEGQMRAMAKGLEKDHELGSALSKRGNQLIGKQWSREWSPSVSGHDISEAARTRSIAQQLTQSLERGRDRGLGL
ncbi:MULTISPECIES: Ti-type conjugative transfer relaxase TraA [unclassified Novosphingobium]|uniref:Ti-type conjugative transfer relaxase TraA n=1 Tax=unclassified Novosphingobium TaxID=2644732 RepID=UPI00146C6A79|nr:MULTISPECIES: Ti-type conjugative transfer relaxase TraA [unclassified Novosphingobium]NMN05877.1 Ti-type conjugative transfer relaxase TraA [Novosphingobium sp. SG919]NMN87763.1 Ti-type conjugative transfer relaxase TraA [Novosphingobium sp. SG916]